MRRISIVLALAWMCLAPWASAAEQPDAGVFRQFHHTSWTRKDGAPVAISALAQTSDGWMWIGSSVGLYRFDGEKFERHPDIDGGVRSLHTLPDGSLWIGHALGGITLLRNGRIVRTANDDGMPGIIASDFATDPHGRVWFVAREGLFRREGERWVRVDLGAGVAMHPLSQTIYIDREGTVWLRTHDAVMASAGGTEPFRRIIDVAPDELQTTFTEAPDGAVWVSGIETGVRRLSLRGASPAPAGVDLEANAGPFLYDTEGRLWRLSLSSNEIEVRPPAALAGFQGGELPRLHDTFGKGQGLSGNGTFHFLEDREGNLWLGTTGGLDRFRRNKLHRMPYALSLSAIAESDGGGLWSSGFPDIDLARYSGESITPYPKAQPFIVCAYRDPKGVVWLGGVGGLVKAIGDTLERVSLPPGWGPQEFSQAMTMDRDGRLWVAVKNDVHRLAGGTWSKWAAPAALQRMTMRVMATDERGRIWIGYGQNTIAVVDGEQVDVLSDDAGLQVGDVMAIHPHAGHVWVGGSRGTMLFEGGKFRPVVTSAATPLRNVSGIVETAQGELWLNGGDGIARIGRPEVERVLADRQYRPAVEMFDAQDGLDGVAPQRRPLPSTLETRDGRLWFTSSNGLYWIDPKHIARNKTVPPVLIRAIRVDDTSYAVDAGMTLPQRTRSMTIDYTALSLSIPERVRFRYRLEGVDEDWQAAGARRQAHYTNLGPGAYRFHVAAANEDGVWNEAGATLDFSIAPAFYQTAWFRGALVALALLMLWGLYRWRLQVTKARMRDQLRERLTERERIARELHDTLLQSLMGLILRFDAATKKLPRDEAREALEAALEEADTVLAEGRDRVQGLRVVLGTADLTNQLTSVGRELARDGSVQFVPDVPQAMRRLQPAVIDEVFWIAREALLNAFRHAQAQRVELHVRYADDGLSVCVRDDGQGIDADVLRAGSRPGHFGMLGMAERARKIGAQLRIVSDGSEGTRIEVRVPAALAYRDSNSLLARLLRRRRTPERQAA